MFDLNLVLHRAVAVIRLLLNKHEVEKLKGCELFNYFDEEKDG